MKSTKQVLNEYSIKKLIGYQTTFKSKKSIFLSLSQFNSVEYYLIYGKIFIKHIFNLPVGGIKKPPEN